MKDQLPLLTPIRGFAAIIVSYFHARLILFPQWLEPIIDTTHFLENGWIWVDIFFILSGFVMMHVYRDTFRTNVPYEEWGRFMWLRFSRIYPLFLTTFLVLLAWETYKYFHHIGFYGGPIYESWGVNGLPAFQGPLNSGGSIASTLLLLQGITSNGLVWNFPGWSLSVEWLSYMFFPLMAVALASSAKQTVWVPILTALIVFCLIHDFGTLDVTSSYGAILRGLAGFSLGVWLCQIKLSTVWQKLANNSLVIIGLIVAVGAVVHTQLTAATTLLCYILFALLILFSANHTPDRSVALSILDNKLTRWLGDISYSVYLWHSVILIVGVEVINLVTPDSLTWWYAQSDLRYLALSFVALLSVLLSVASLSYVYIEKPAMKFLRKKRAPKAAPKVTDLTSE